MSYAIQITPSAERAMNRLPKADRARVDRRIADLANNPRSHGAVPLRGGGHGFWRIRLGDWRVVYKIHDDVLVVLVINVAHRREVYRGL